MGSETSPLTCYILIGIIQHEKHYGILRVKMLTLHILGQERRGQVGAVHEPDQSI